MKAFVWLTVAQDGTWDAACALLIDSFQSRRAITQALLKGILWALEVETCHLGSDLSSADIRALLRTVIFLAKITQGKGSVTGCFKKNLTERFRDF